MESLSHVQPYVTPWTVALQAPLCTGFSRQEYWSGFPFPSLGDLPNPGIEPASPVSPAFYAGSLLSEPGFPGGLVFIKLCKIIPAAKEHSPLNEEELIK